MFEGSAALLHYFQFISISLLPEQRHCHYIIIAG